MVRNFKKFQYSVVAGLILIISYIAISVILNDNPYLQQTVSDLLSILINFTAAFCLVYASYKSRIYGKQITYAWLLLALAQFLYAVGDIIWTFIELFLHTAPFPSLADDLYLLYYVLFATGLILLSRPLISTEKIYKTILDIGIILTSAVLIFWTTLALPITANSFLPLSLTLYYIIRDFVLFFLVLNLTLRQPTEKMRDPFLLLLGGISAYIITDTVFSYFFLNGIYVSGSLVDIGWIIAFILIGHAGIVQGNNVNKIEIMDNKRPKHVISSFIPLLWVSTALFMLIWGYYNLPPSNFANVQLRFVIFIILVLIRYLMSILEKKGLFNTLKR
ncbi:MULTISPECIES: hypothetical protein [Methanobacterium]|uniref:hypothetical protein n=1 Tax=Methanobacterium TaxID=2160 RepID=UPI00114CCC47|nr:MULTISPECIES: hypothetical protein [Methanobacterium]